MIVVAEIWRSTALIMIILVAGPAGDPAEYNEAAEVFGASFFRRPLRDPADAQAVDPGGAALRIILAFEVFSTVIAITGDGSTVLAAEA